MIVSYPFPKENTGDRGVVAPFHVFVLYQSRYHRRWEFDPLLLDECDPVKAYMEHLEREWKLAEEIAGIICLRVSYYD